MSLSRPLGVTAVSGSVNTGGVFTSRRPCRHPSGAGVAAAAPDPWCNSAHARGRRRRALTPDPVRVPEAAQLTGRSRGVGVAANLAV